MADNKDPGYQFRGRSMSLGEFIDEWTRKGKRAWRAAQDAGRAMMGGGSEAAGKLSDVLKMSGKGYSDTLKQAPESARNIKKMKADLERMGKK